MADDAMIDPPGDGNQMCAAGEWHRDVRGLWAVRRCQYYQGHMNGSHSFGAWRYNVTPPGDGLTTGADSADSGVPRTVNAEARDQSPIPNPQVAASSAAPIPSEIDPPTRANRDGDQPLPTTNALPCVQDLVIADIEQRKEIGRKRYGTVLQPFNGRDTLRDAYEEAIDLVMYLRQLRYEWAAADPALRTLRLEWLKRATYLDSKEPTSRLGGRELNWARAGAIRECAADLDRVCPEIRDEQKESPTDPV